MYADGSKTTVCTEMEGHCNPHNGWMAAKTEGVSRDD